MGTEVSEENTTSVFRVKVDGWYLRNRICDGRLRGEQNVYRSIEQISEKAKKVCLSTRHNVVEGRFNAVDFNLDTRLRSVGSLTLQRRYFWE
jgi:hypothetical protein